VKKPTSFQPFFPIGIFLFGALSAALLLQNLPFKFGDELSVIYRIREASWGTVLQALLNPFASAWYIHGGESLFVSRILEAFLFKVLFTLFGYNPNAFWSLNILGFAASGVFIFFFLLLLTKNQWLGVVGSLFFYFLPPVFRCISWVADVEIVVQAFVLASFLIFWILYTSSQKNRFSAFGLLLLLFICSWLGMRLKETGRIIPVVILGFLVLDQNRHILNWLGKDRKNGWLLAILLLLLATVIPWRAPRGLELDSLSHTAIFKFDLNNLAMTLNQLMPLLAPPLVALLGCILLAKVGKRRKEMQEFSWPRGMPIFFLIWIGLCMMGYSMNFQLEGNIRYLTTILVPLTVFILALFERPLRELCEIQRGLARPVAFALLGISVLFQADVEEGRLHLNAKSDEILFIRNFHIGTDIAEYFLTKKVYEDRFGKSEPSWQELERFRWGRSPAQKGEFVEIRVKHWDPSQDSSVESLEKVARKWGVAYVLSFENGLYREDRRVKQIHKISTNTGSLYSLLISKIKKKSHRLAYLYRFSP